MRICQILSVAALALVVAGCGSGSSVGGDPMVETFPDEGAAHVPQDTPITYNTDPPTSGTHYPAPAAGGFYDAPIPAGNLVHTMEHGGIIIYYNPATVTAQQQAEIEAFLQPAIGEFSTVVAVPRNDPQFDIILTAWRTRLRLPDYDINRIRDFTDVFIGHGPENL